MNGLMMDFQLTLPTLLRRAEAYSGSTELVTRLPDRSFQRITYAESCRRARALAVALKQLGLQPGDRVATLCWNHLAHHEAYLGIPLWRLRAAHAEPAPASERSRLHRDARRGSRRDRRQEPGAVARSVPCEHEHRARVRRRGQLRRAARGRRPGRVGRPAARRGRRRGDVLHERHDRAAEGRPLFAQVDDAPHPRRCRRKPDGPRHLRAGRDPAGGADVPRERLGVPVSGDDARREARLSRPVPRPGEPARHVRVRGRDVDGRRPDDLARHPAAARRRIQGAGTSRG